MRGLILFSLGFGGAMALCATGMAPVWIWTLLAVSVALLGGTLYFRKRLPVLGMGTVLCLGLIAASGWYLVFRSVWLVPVMELDGTTQRVTLEVSDYSYQTDYGTGVDCRMEIGGKGYKVRVYLDGEQTLSPGDRIEGSFRLRSTLPGGEKEATYHRGSGIFLLAYEKETPEIIPGSDEGVRYLPVRLRKSLLDRLDALFPEDAGAFARALLLGDSTGLSYETETSLRVSGIRHVIAVSGLHVSILFGLVQVFTLKKRFLTVGVGLPVLLLFAAVTGFTPSVSRACLMIGLMLLSLALDREYDPPTALAFSVVVMLSVNPLTVTSAGWQMSVASVAGMFLFQRPIGAWLEARLGRGPLGKIGKRIASSVSVSLSATLLTTPFSAGYFGTVSLVGPLTNLLTLWLIGPIFYGILLVCLLGSVWTAGAVFAAKLVALPIRCVLGVAKVLSKMPVSALYTVSPYVTVWLIFLYILLVVFLLERKKKPVLLISLAGLGLVCVLLAGWLEPLTGECRVTVLDVGQGQSILLQSRGHSFLVDCGGSRDDETADIVAETLLSQGVTRLDGIVITHYDRDHAGALANLLTRIDTDLLILPPGGETALSEAVTRVRGQTVYLTEDGELTWKNMKMTIFAPAFSFESNENSLCVLFQTENCDILITGDRSGFGERLLLRHTRLPELELLVVGHHGSKYSTCEELLEATKPETAVISVGASNPYGHPAREVLERLEEIGCVVYRTDLQGTVIFRR